MMTKINKVILLLLLVSLAGICYSQDNDYGLWLGMDVEHKLCRKLDLEFSGGVKFSEKVSQMDQLFVGSGLQFKFSKFLSLSASYRLTSKLEDNSRYYYRHKFFLDLKTALPAGNFSFSGRFRLQRTSKTYLEEKDDRILTYCGRLKLKAAYNIPHSPVNPYLYEETFISGFSGNDWNLNKYRLSAGTEIKITRKSSIDLGYIFQHFDNSKSPNGNILSINYNLRF